MAPQLPFSSSYVPAPLSSRLLAALIDLLVVVLQGLLGGVPGVAYKLLADGLFDGASVGKKAMGIRVIVLETGAPCDFVKSIIRHVGVLVPCLGQIYAVVELVKLVIDPQHRRFADDWAGTMVVKA